jgi:hypothetical protein
VTSARLRLGLRGLLLGLLMMFGGLQAQPLELQSVLPSATLSGHYRFTHWGFQVYEARLWVAPGFKANEYERHAFALELTYLRDFSNAAISKRSLEEMERQPGFPMEKRASWQQALRSAFPDVHKGDRITGIYQPDKGTVFLTNGRETGMIADTAFGPIFFGIWLSAQSPEPRMRAALLAVGGAK